MKTKQITAGKFNFAFNIWLCKINTIVLAGNHSALGIGSGQPSRLDSCKTAIDKMNKFSNVRIGFAASDAFSFCGWNEKLVQSGVTAVVQPSGSIRDKE